jgi:signal transduction histidine kinase
VDRLQRVALEIGSGRLAARMPIEGRGDELDLFAGTVNRMIGEVERTVDQVKSVTDAIAHDLRTPLTRVRNQLYRASRDPDMAPADVVRIEAAMPTLISFWRGSRRCCAFPSWRRPAAARVSRRAASIGCWTRWSNCTARSPRSAMSRCDGTVRSRCACTATRS